MAVISMKQLLEAGVHFGHQTRRWNPKMAQYIRPSTLFGQRFEEYLGAATAAQERKGRRANRFAEYD